MIEATLNLIKEQTGLELKRCDSFPLVYDRNGKTYFNALLNDRISESKEYNTLESFALKYNLIKIEPNGFKRVAIFPLINT